VSGGVASPASASSRVWGRLGAGSGSIFIVAFNLALFDLGAPPKASDSSRQIALILTSHHARILGGMYLAGVAMMLGTYFFATVRTWLIRASEGPETPLAGSALAGGLLAIGLGVLGMLLYYGATYKIAGHGGLSAVRGLTDAGNASIELTKFPLAVFIVAVSVAARQPGLLSASFIRAGFASACVLIATAIPLFAHGSFTQFGGGLDVLGGLPAVIWIFGLSLTMLRHERRATVVSAGGDALTSRVQ
jgi:hypothetical protein